MRHITTLLLILIESGGSLLAQQYNGPKADVDQILEHARAFSEHFVAGDMEAQVDKYHEDASIIQNKRPFMTGSKA